PALVRSLRYGDVRGTDTRALTEVAAGLAERIFVGLPPACAALDGDAAEEMRRHVDAVQGAVGLLDDAPALTGPETESIGEASEQVERAAGGPSDGSAVEHPSVGRSAAGSVPGHRDLRRRWHAVLRVLSLRDTVPGVIRGRAVRLLLDEGRLGQDEAARLMGLVLSPGAPPGG